jgi:hypothetical protein
MTAKGSDTPPVAAQAAGLVADGLASALARFVGPLDDDREDAGATPAPPPRSLPGRAAEAGRGAARRAARTPAAASGLLEAVLSRIVPVVVRSMDPEEIVERVDVQALVDRVDVQGVVSRLDLNEIVARVDLNRTLDSVDPNRLLDRVDLDHVVERVDMGPVAREALEGIDMGELIRESTASIGQDTVEAVRVRAMRFDDGVARIVDRVFRRSRPRDTGLEPPEAGS